jgi:group I intron endonuclease
VKIKIYIYAIYFPVSDKYYIGQTKNLNRLIGHLRSDLLVGKALWKYNDWKVSILHTVFDRDVANQIEIEEIRNFNSVAPNGYNLTHGGNVGSYLSEITKEKISRSMMNNINGKGMKKDNSGENNPFHGRKHSEETKKKMRVASKKRRWKSIKAKLNGIISDGKIVK